MKKLFTLLFVFLISLSMAQSRKKKSDKKATNDTIKSSLVSGLKFRSIGPAFTSGRIAEFAVNPDNNSEYYVATASGHVWKTTNAGTTYKPVFDNYGAYSIGWITLDPNNHNVVWIGTGESNHQRALGYGNGVYKSLDGGKSWKNMGLKDSRQIGGVAIDPRNSDIVYVAAEGSVWGPGGDRGLYKTEDGGKSWNKVLEISENTGVNSIIIDIEDPDVLFATSEQRRRHVFTKIGGGPESAIYKSTDAGENWRKLSKGIPGGHKGGIGLAISPVDHNIVYAIIEAANNAGGFFRSTDRGESWKKMSSHSSSGQYYTKILCDPINIDKVYSLETRSHYTEDAGKTWKRLGLNKRHVDDHALWIDPKDTKHFLIGGDGGVYETYDGGKNYHFKENLPVTQLYRVNVDNDYPFYNVYGGTQDNSSFGGPSRNLKGVGVSSAEWTVTLGGDGFWQAIDPDDPNIVYSEYQYGNIYRFDKKSGEKVKIRPEPRKGEDTYKWNWNAPFILSPHSKTRLYIAANKVFRSDDRGNSWEVISDDISAKIDRNHWKTMDKYWSIDAVVKDVSTSLYGMAVAIDESPIKEGLIYIGTDDGLIQVTENAGQDWRKIEHFPEVPAQTYVSHILSSKFDENVVFACFDNIKRDDFKPYLLKSSNKGKSWTSITGNLPENETVLTIEQDHINPDLLFVGTEFGVYFTIDGGKIWTRLKAGIPDVKITDIVVQKRENDLVLSTFGRGFYIIDDYSPLRELSKDFIDKEAHLFTVKDALMYIKKGGGYGGGSTHYIAKNPPFGAIFTYYLKENPKTLKQQRHKKEKELFKKGEKIPVPTVEERRKEKSEIKPFLLFTITDEYGNIVCKIAKKPAKGIHRISWDLRYESPWPVNVKKKYNPLKVGGGTLLAMPGKYKVKLSMVQNGEMKDLSEAVSFVAKTIDNRTLPAPDRKEVVVFENKLNKLLKALKGAERATNEMLIKVENLKASLHKSTLEMPILFSKLIKISSRLDDVKFLYTGSIPEASQEEDPPDAVSINERVNSAVWARWNTTGMVTQTQKDALSILEEESPPLLVELKKINLEIKTLEKQLFDAGAPWIPGQIPEWEKE